MKKEERRSLLPDSLARCCEGGPGRETEASSSEGPGDLRASRQQGKKKKKK